MIFVPYNVFIVVDSCFVDEKSFVLFCSVMFVNSHLRELSPCRGEDACVTQ